MANLLAKLPEKLSVTSQYQANVHVPLYMTVCCCKVKIYNHQKTFESPIMNSIEIICSQFQSGDTFFLVFTSLLRQK